MGRGVSGSQQGSVDRLPTPGGRGDRQCGRGWGPAQGDQFMPRTHLYVHGRDRSSALIPHAVLSLPGASLIALPPSAGPHSPL